MDSTYAPQSPDLSGLLASPSKQQHQYQSTSQYAPQSPNLSSFNAQPSPHRNLHAFQAPQNRSFGGGFDEYKSAQYMPEIPALPSAHNSFTSPSTASQYFSAPGQPGLQPYQTHIKTESSYNAYTPPPPSDMASRGARQPRAQGQASSSTADAPAYKNPNPNNIDIKTKFPVARIKRIMQADEEVGKVAQVTPVAVSKALELFMISLVSSAAEKAKEKGGKRVTAQHLKQVVTEGDQFDFLVDIVAKISEAQEGAGGETKKRKEKNEGTDSDDDEPKKPKKGKGRRKKSDD